MSIVIFIFILGILIAVHEAGHFFLAKLNNIRVVEFWIGMGPAIIKFYRGGTKFALRVLPFGGACIFDGDGFGDDEDEADKDEIASNVNADSTSNVDGKNNTDNTSNADSKNSTDSNSNIENERDVDGKENVDSRKDVNRKEHAKDAKAEESFIANTDLGENITSFPEASVGARMTTILAGPLSNFVLAFILSIFLVNSIGSDIPIVQNVSEGSGAEAAGIEEGDRITSVNGHRVQLGREISFQMMFNEGEDLELTYERDGKKHDVEVTPKYYEEAERYLIGVGWSRQELGFLDTIKYSYYEVKFNIVNTVKSLFMLITGQLGMDNLMGPVGIAQVVDDVYEEAKPHGMSTVWLSMLSLTILLSANLGVINFVPIPGLDGGKLLFLIIEAIRRKPISPEKEGFVQMVGFALILILMVYVLFNDIMRLF